MPWPGNLGIASPLPFRAAGAIDTGNVAFLAGTGSAARFRPAHKLEEYNAVQSVLNWVVRLSAIMVLLFGLAI